MTWRLTSHHCRLRSQRLLRMRMDLGDRVKLWRRERGLSQERLAEMARVSTRTVQRTEAGDRTRVTTVGALANALEVTATQLYSGPPSEELNELKDSFTCPTC